MDRKLKTTTKQRIDRSNNNFKKPYSKKPYSQQPYSKFFESKPYFLQIDDDEMFEKCSKLEKSEVPSRLLKLNLPEYKITRIDINKIFKNYGEIRQMYISKKDNFAVILYDNLEDAMCAYRESNFPGIMLDETDIKLTYLKNPGIDLWPKKQEITRKNFGYPSNPRDSDDEMREKTNKKDSNSDDEDDYVLRK